MRNQLSTGRQNIHENGCTERKWQTHSQLVILNIETNIEIIINVLIIPLKNVKLIVKNGIFSIKASQSIKISNFIEKSSHYDQI